MGIISQYLSMLIRDFSMIMIVILRDFGNRFLKDMMGRTDITSMLRVIIILRKPEDILEKYIKIIS